MYTTRSVHKNKTDLSYISIGDPYVDIAEKLPARWKAKQFAVVKKPPNGAPNNSCQAGMFHPLTYKSDPFREMEKYTATQPPEKRKRGFGTNDASRRGEFTSTIRTEQYRETLKAEYGMNKVNDELNKDAVDKLLAEESKRESNREFVQGQKEIKFLYDVGRTNDTVFNPKCHREKFYGMMPAQMMSADAPKRMGPYRTTSQLIGEEAWQHPGSKPKFGPVSHMKNFYDKSHLEVGAF